MEITVSNTALAAAAANGCDEFVTLVKDSIADAVGGELNGESLQKLNAQQITLWAYFILRDEVMDGGFVQLIHNGYGPFFFRNPFARVMRTWGLDDMAWLVKRANRLYNRYGAEITAEHTEEEFMAMFEKYPDYDELDDFFVENEEATTAAVAHYVDEHLEEFITVADQ